MTSQDDKPPIWEIYTYYRVFELVGGCLKLADEPLNDDYRNFKEAITAILDHEGAGEYSIQQMHNVIHLS